MTPKTEQILKDLAGYYDLQIEYVTDLPDNLSGFLQPGSDSCHVVVNANKPPSDQVFTIAHELAHYVMHLNRPPKDFAPGYLKTPWENKWLSKFSRLSNRWIRWKLNPEWQADLWAFIFLLYIGATDDLVAITEMYPKKSGMFWWAVATMLYCGIKQRIKNFFRGLLHRDHQP